MGRFVGAGRLVPAEHVALEQVERGPHLGDRGVGPQRFGGGAAADDRRLVPQAEGQPPGDDLVVGVDVGVQRRSLLEVG